MHSSATEGQEMIGLGKQSRPTHRPIAGPRSYTALQNEEAAEDDLSDPVAFVMDNESHDT
jgi:hypothetical protein